MCAVRGSEFPAPHEDNGRLLPADISRLCHVATRVSLSFLEDDLSRPALDDLSGCSSPKWMYCSFIHTNFNYFLDRFHKPKFMKLLVMGLIVKLLLVCLP